MDFKQGITNISRENAKQNIIAEGFRDCSVCNRIFKLKTIRANFSKLYVCENSIKLSIYCNSQLQFNLSYRNIYGNMDILKQSALKIDG